MAGMALARHGTRPAWHWPGMALALARPVRCCGRVSRHNRSRAKSTADSRTRSAAPAARHRPSPYGACVSHVCLRRNASSCVQAFGLSAVNLPIHYSPSLSHATPRRATPGAFWLDYWPQSPQAAAGEVIPAQCAAHGSVRAPLECHSAAAARSVQSHAGHSHCGHSVLRQPSRISAWLWTETRGVMGCHRCCGWLTRLEFGVGLRTTVVRVDLRRTHGR
jgi:hypothetical protein